MSKAVRSSQSGSLGFAARNTAKQHFILKHDDFPTEHNSTGKGDPLGHIPTEAYDSLIQVLKVAENWEEATLTWNSAPMAMENVSRAWVPVYNPNPLVWPGAARDWDVSRAASMAYETNGMLRLVLYSAEAPQHTGKYFVSSDVGDWNAVGRPTLIIEWGNP